VILAGDVGGTNARFSVYTPDGARAIRTEKLLSKDFASVEQAAAAFLGMGGTGGGKGEERITAACIGVAGPVLDGRCETTNLPWILDERVIAKALSIPRVVLINDLVALGLGALTLPPDRLRRIHGSRLPGEGPGNVAILAAGTGLGEAILVRDGRQLVPCNTEGGHTDFAPRNALEVELLQFLIQRIGGRVSYERVLSGPGIGNLYDFFQRVKKLGDPAGAPGVSEAIDRAEDRNAAIAQRGLAKESRAATAALDLFGSLYGAEAGNLVLKSLATSGVFLAGNISIHLLELLERGSFIASFEDKGRMSPLLHNTPVAVVLDADVGLAGSARHAATLASLEPSHAA
jgi:glucokinase